MRKDMNQRPIPEAALRDENSVEMLRIWIAERGLHCSMKVGMYSESKGPSEEKAWGTMLSDVIRHLGDALHSEYGGSKEQIIQKIFDKISEELANPTSMTQGGFVQKH
jgi:Domain of unknown function (DUF5076)